MDETNRQRKASNRTQKSTVRTSRDDGDLTKARIIEVAGMLFAEKGYADTTSKEICEVARTNIAAVNYHFGGREGLYDAVIKEMNSYFRRSHFILDIGESDLSPHEKLARILDRFTAAVYRSGSWQIRLWAREKVAPAGRVDAETRAEMRANMGLIERLVREITGIPPGDVVLDLCFLNVMAPFLVLLITGGKLPVLGTTIFRSDADTVSADLKEFIFAGLDAFAERYAARDAAMRGTDTV